MVVTISASGSGDGGSSPVGTGISSIAGPCDVTSFGCVENTGCLIFADGLEVIKDGNDYKVSQNPLVRVSHTNGVCDGTVTPFSSQIFKEIVFGEGLTAAGAGCTVTVEQVPLVNVVGLANPFSGLEFIGGLTPNVKAGEGCIAQISGSELTFGNDIGSCDISTPFDCTGITGDYCITFGVGLEAFQNANGVRVDQNPLTNILGSGGLTTITEGSTGLYSTLAFPDCFEIKPDGCTAVIDLDGIDQTVETVCNIQCGDGTVTVDTITMEFKCGLLTSVTACGDTPVTANLEGSNPLLSASTNTPISAAANENQKVFFVSAALGDTLLTLHEASAVTGRQYSFKKTDATVNQVVVSGTGSNTIDGQPTYTLTNQYEVVKVMSDGSQWYIV